MYCSQWISKSLCCVKEDRQRRLWNEWLHVHESVKQDFVWAKESIHYISILNFLCTLSLLLHNIHVSWPLPAYLDLPVLRHQQDGIPLDERSINCLPSLLLEDTNCFQSFVLTAPPQWNSLYACLVHVGKSIQLEHRFLEWTFRVKGMQWLFLGGIQNTAPSSPGYKGFPGPSQGTLRALSPQLPVKTGIRNHYHSPR